ncbi:MAG: protein-glutamate O-methyltransferase CheR [Alphaproteobacteria bacterium]|uniref:protein-glutamate O-methyltransferase n=1 Tax=Candidatus Nitrobium versatile TaxID=2884831 RepID=A0A953M3G1_9BACT|nr:protein-glutamate O-methyltransferase CheR [Candidatus Nitrobium versatile]
MTGDLQQLLNYVRNQRAIDFAAYRLDTIRHRLDLRLAATSMPDYASYHKYVIENPPELDALVDSLTIKISRFFRNSLVFEALREVVLPDLLNAFGKDTIRIWCAGCARGEEAYSIAILVKEIFAQEDFPAKVFIIGTDLDSEALANAKEALYKSDALVEVKKDYLDKYFDFVDGIYHLKDEIKSLVTFAYHDITTLTAPREGIFSNYHLILCRNVLIYFNQEISLSIRKSLSDAVVKNGYLVLGESETVGKTLTIDYEEIMNRTKIFKKR